MPGSAPPRENDREIGMLNDFGRHHKMRQAQDDIPAQIQLFQPLLDHSVPGRVGAGVHAAQAREVLLGRLLFAQRVACPHHADVFVDKERPADATRIETRHIAERQIDLAAVHGGADPVYREVRDLDADAARVLFEHGEKRRQEIELRRYESGRHGRTMEPRENPVKLGTKMSVMNGVHDEGREAAGAD